MFQGESAFGSAPLFFFVYHSLMVEASFLNREGIDPQVREKFSNVKVSDPRIPSDAQAPATSERVDQLVLPAAERGKMPFTKEKFIIKENAALVAWERVTREFLRQLSVRHAHRVSAVMVFEWATGRTVKEHLASGGSTTDLKNINKVLRFYFGDPYMTYICGRKVPRAFKVKPGYYIKRHRPMTLTLYAEYAEGTLST